MRKFVSITVLIIVSLFLTSCDGGNEQRTSAKTASKPPWDINRTPAYVWVIIDETASFSDEWDNVLKCMMTTIPRLRGRDRICVYRIDNKAGDKDDVIVNTERIEENPIKARQQKTKMMKTIRDEITDLKQRTNPVGGSDIFGCILYAAHELNRAKERQAEYKDDFIPILIVFSDFRPDQRWPSTEEVDSLSLPRDTTFRAFSVSMKSTETSTGTEEWNKTVRRWIGYLGQSGILVTETDFFDPNETMDYYPKFLDKILPY